VTAYPTATALAVKAPYSAKSSCLPSPIPWVGLPKHKSATLPLLFDYFFFFKNMWGLSTRGGAPTQNRRHSSKMTFLTRLLSQAYKMG